MPKKKELREFGLLVGGVLLLIGLYPLYRGEDVRFWAAVPGGALLALGLAAPQALVRPYSLWMKLAHVMMVVNTRVILSVLFFLVVCPTALMLRLAGKDVLGLRKGEASHWVPTNKEGGREGFERQF